MKISVIVPVYNAAPYLPRCIDALLAQDIDSTTYEILMVDNGSTDASAAIAGRYPEVRLLREPKQGSYAARNRALRDATGELLAFTDADCAPEPNWLSELLVAFRSPGTRVVIGHTYPEPSSTLLHGLGAYDAAKDAYVLGSGIAPLYYGRTNNMGVSKSALDELGGFAEWRRGADVIFVQRAIERFSCRAVRFCRGARVRHLEVNSLWRYYQKLFIYARSHRRYSEAVPTRALTVRERLEVLATLRGRLPLGQRVALLSVLGLGLIPWWLGGATARWGAPR